MSSEENKDTPTGAAAEQEVPLGPDGKPLSKKALKKLEQKRLKEERKKQREEEQRRKAEEKAKADAAADFSRGLYGKSEVIRSDGEHSATSSLEYVEIKDLSSHIGKEVRLRCRVHTNRASGNLVFIVLRHREQTVQLVAAKNDSTISKPMIKFLQSVTPESIVEVTADATAPPEPVTGTTQSSVELQCKTFFVKCPAATPLPIQLEDCERPQPLIDEQEREIEAIAEKIKKKEEELAAADGDAKETLKKELEALVDEKSRALKFPVVGQNQRLDNRVIELRTTTNQAIFKIQSATCMLFREFLISHGFTEIHTPKLISTASEGGADVFKVGYFGGNAYLAQSPQLYKQMCIAADFDRVFEIGPVFRAENSNTHRHMTEFMGMDMEMAFKNHYHEVLDMLDAMFISIFDGLKERFDTELEIIKRQFPFEDLVYHRPSLRLNYTEAIEMLNADGFNKQPTDDISTSEEKRLGELVKQKYNTDFFILDKFPLCVRPFYTMPDPHDDRFSNSYDVFLRGEEIMSGAQRIHDMEMLIERAKVHEIELDTIRAYIEAFKYGAPPHGGGGVGMERIVMLYLGVGNIRKTALFPRDPKRLTP